MNKKIIWVLVVAVVIIGGYLLSTKDDTSSPANEAPTNTQTTTTTPKPKPLPTGITTSTTPVPSTGKVQVDIKGFNFVSKTVKIAPGTTITWKNFDSVPHSVVGPDFNSGILYSGQSFSHKFTKEGDFSYYSGLDADMSGNIVVRY